MGLTCRNSSLEVCKLQSPFRAPTSGPSGTVTNGKVARELPFAPALLIRHHLAQKPPFRALASMLGRKQELLTVWRADHQIKSWHSANNPRLAPCAAGGDAIASRFRPVHVVT